MKEIIDVKVRVRKTGFSQCKTDVLAVGHFSDSKGLDKVNSELDKKLQGAIARVIELGDFKGKDGDSAIIYGNENIAARRILLVGLGEKKKVTLDSVRRAAALAAEKAVDIKAETVGLGLHKALGRRFDVSRTAAAMAEGAYYGSYRYDEFIGEDENGRLGRLEVEIIDSESDKTGKLRKGATAGTVIGQAQSYARTLANRPGNVVTPAELAETAKKLAGQYKSINCTVFDEKQLKEEGMGGILAVGAGSKNGPRLIILKYNGGKKANRLPTVALVGKAVTFDSGGISIKPAAKMEEMKLDKSGGIAVLATVKAAAELRLGVNIYGIIPSAENLPSGTSYRPGDIITTFSKKTVEIHSTDAEGRMILCDAISYAVKQNCEIVIDIATLTGACKVALGQYMAAVMGNDDRLIKQLRAAADESGEKVWPMPCGDEYAKEIKSKIADLKNVGGKWGGACTGAAFLRQFVEDSKWAHLDIAGVDIFVENAQVGGQGASGFGVRLLTRYLINLTQNK